MKTSVTNKLKKVLAGIMLVAVSVFVSCEKDNDKPGNNGGNNQPQKHNVELLYDRTMSSIHVDTIAKYASQPDIDTIYLIPENTHQFGGFSVNQLPPYIKALRKRHEVAPTRVFGKGDLFVNSSVEPNTDAYKFFADTLKYNVIRNNAKNM